MFHHFLVRLGLLGGVAVFVAFSSFGTAPTTVSAHFNNCRGWSELSVDQGTTLRYSGQTRCDNGTLAAIGVISTLWKIGERFDFTKYLEIDIDFLDNAADVTGTTSVGEGCYVIVSAHGGVIVHRHQFGPVPWPHEKNWGTLSVAGVIPLTCV